MAQGWGPTELDGVGGARAFTEGAGGVAILPTLTVYEPDNNLISTRVAFTGGYRPGEDVLALGAGPGIGSITGSFNAATGVLTLTSTSQELDTAWQAALRAVTYANTSEDPNVADRTLSITLTDGFGYTAAVTQTVTVTGVNDAPSGGSSATSMELDATRILSAADFGFTDVDGDALLAVRIASLPAGGSLTLSGAAVTAGQSISAADIAAGRLVFTPAGSGAASFTFQVQDDGGVAAGGVDLDPTPNTLTINVAAAPPPPPREIPSAGGPGADLAILDDNPTRYAAGDGDDLAMADGGADTVHGNLGNDTLYGGAGEDIVRGGQGGDVLYGDDGNDWLFGDKGDDFVHGGRGDDEIEGGEGSDALAGGQGNDSLSGGDGADVLSGDRGNDTLAGGAGPDVFRFTAGGGADVIVDFDGAQDRVQVAGAYTLSQHGADVVVDLGGGDTLTLQNVELSGLPAGWIFS